MEHRPNTMPSELGGHTKVVVCAFIFIWSFDEILDSLADTAEWHAWSAYRQRALEAFCGYAAECTSGGVDVTYEPCLGRISVIPVEKDCYINVYDITVL